MSRHRAGAEERLRIGIDATVVGPERMTGVERHALSWIRALSVLASWEVVLFIRPDAPSSLEQLPVERHRAPVPWRPTIDQVWLPLAAARARVDLLHTLAYPTPLLWRGRSALTVHDATPWLYPEVLPATVRWYYGPLFPQALRRASAIFTPSRASKYDLIRAIGLPSDRIHVIPNGVDSRFFEARTPEGPRSPYLLAVGTIEPRKNLPTLLEAFRILRREGRDLQLVLAGHQAFTHSLPLGDLVPYVRLPGRVSEEELPILYAGAAGFVLCSLYEGFGLPLAEAMAAGTPAVASDIPALREVGGETIRYADPDSPASFAAAIAAVLDQREETVSLASAARERARRFSWEVAAQETLAVYRQLLS